MKSPFDKRIKNPKKGKRELDIPDETIRYDKLKYFAEHTHLSENELLTALRSLHIKRPKKYKIELSKKSFSYLYFSDSHIGHKKFQYEAFEKMVMMAKKYKPDFALSIGDNLEGMSNRPGHIYELNQVGFEAQIQEAVRLFKKIPTTIYGIDGNHDGWYFNKADHGIIVGDELQLRLPNYKNLGQMEGHLNVNNVEIMLFHPNDGTAYANSYKLQKLVESFTGGEKPAIVHSGHYHKSLSQFSRNVFGFESGTLCGQSDFMRGKKLAAHIGFGFVRVFHNKNGTIDRLVHEFVPFFEPIRKSHIYSK